MAGVGGGGGGEQGTVQVGYGTNVFLLCQWLFLVQ